MCSKVFVVGLESVVGLERAFLDVIGSDGGDCWGAAELHAADEFLSEQFHHVGDAFAAGGCESVDVGSADADRVSAQRQGFEDVGASAEAAVDQDGDFALNGVHDFREGFDGAAAAFELTAPMIGDDEAIYIVFQAEVGILFGHDAFEENFHVAATLA